jgi:hypothetical protein
MTSEWSSIKWRIAATVSHGEPIVPKSRRIQKPTHPSIASNSNPTLRNVPHDHARPKQAGTPPDLRASSFKSNRLRVIRSTELCCGRICHRYDIALFNFNELTVSPCTLEYGDRWLTARLANAPTVGVTVPNNTSAALELVYVL